MYKSLVTIGIFLVCVPTLAQVSMVFNRLSTVEGLHTNKVKCVWQDDKGFIWVGTENGLQRFDGRKFVQFFHPEPDKRMMPVAVDEIKDAGNNKIWIRQGNTIGHFDRSLFHYKPVFINHSNKKQAVAGARLFIDSKQHTYLLTKQHGILIYDKKAGMFSDTNVPLKSPRGWPVNAVYEHPSTGDYWISSDSGLAVYNSRSKALYYRDHNPLQIPVFKIQGLQNIRAMVIDQQNHFWIAYWRMQPVEKGLSLLQYDAANRKVIRDSVLNPAGTVYTDINHMIRSGNGNIWAGGINTLLMFDKKSNAATQYRYPNPLDFQLRCRVIYQVFEDHEHNLWLATDNGLFITNPTKEEVFNVLFMNRDDKEILVQSILETKTKENWIGTWGNGINFFDQQFLKIDIPSPLTGNQEKDVFYKKVWVLKQHSKTGHIWMAAHAAYIALVDPKSKKITTDLHPPVFNNETIRSITEDRAGNLWFATLGGKIIKWNYNTPFVDSSFKMVQQFNSGIHQLLIDRQHQVWVATAAEGIIVLNEAGSRIVKHYKQQNKPGYSLSSNKISDLVQYNDSIFFAGGVALNVINSRSGTISQKSIYEGLPGANITQLVLDDKRILWMITNNGLSSFNYASNIFTSYNQKDGIVNADKAVWAKYTMANKEIWFGGENVAFGFRPDLLRNAAIPPRVHITDFRLIDHFIPADSIMALEKVKLQPDQHSFTVYFSALSFLQQDKLNYYYKLVGIDADWVFAGGNNAARYAFLPPGSYTFQVRCENLQGENSPITSLKIFIAPPFYKTWWFAGLLLILAATLIYVIYRLRINRLLAVEKLRNKVARDLHDDMGSTLSTINILSSMAKSRMQTNHVQASEYISKISDNSQRMMEAMDDIVWSIKPDNDTMHKITGRMREFATSVLEAKDIDLHFIVDDDVKDVKLNMEARRDFFLIFKEAVNNIAKYAKASLVTIHIKCHHNQLHLFIKDDGVGFSIDTADSGNGLGNMQKRTEALKGTLNMQSSPGSGTEIYLQVPIQ